LSGIAYLNLIVKAKSKGFDVVLLFVYLESVELAISRVAIRVSKGGHNIPNEVVKRRYLKGVSNFSAYQSLATAWYIYDNSGTEYELVAKKVAESEEVFNFTIYKTIIGYGKR
jgi:predicted ABC-type ATPase